MSAASCTCGARWTGSRIEHCPECHHTFTGTSSGDKHRTGDHAVSTGPDRRRCMTPAEMVQRGLELNRRGQWTNGGTSPWAGQGTVVTVCEECGNDAPTEGHRYCIDCLELLTGQVG